MRKSKIRSISAILSSLAILASLLTVAFIPSSAGASDTPITASIEDAVLDASYNGFTLTLDSTVDYFGGTTNIFNCFYSGQWGDYSSSPMYTSIINAISIEVNGQQKTIGDWGAGASTSFITTVNKNATSGKWELQFFGGGWTDVATQDVVVRIHEGFVMHDGTPVAPVTLTREAGPALKSGIWVKTEGASPAPTSVMNLLDPDYVNFAPTYLFGMRLVLKSTWTTEMTETAASTSGEFQTVHNPDSGIFNSAISQEVVDGINNCVLINGKTIKEINTAADMDNAVEVRLSNWGGNQHYWFLISPDLPAAVLDLSQGKSFTVQTLAGLVDYQGRPVAPIAKRWNGSNAFSDYDPTQTTAALEAAAITSVKAPENGDTQLEIPTVAEGCTIKIKSTSNPDAISLTGAITQTAEPQLVKLVFTVTDSDGNNADTATISVTVPRTATVLTPAQEAADAITGIEKIAYTAEKVTLPAVPEGFSIAIKSSTNTAAIALDGTVTKGANKEEVDLVFTVTDTDGNTSDTVGLTVSVPKLITGEAQDITEVQAPDYENYTAYGWRFGLRLIMPTVYDDATMVADAVQWPEWPDQPNKGISDELSTGVNDCILFNGKSIRQINKEAGSPTALHVQFEGWGASQTLHLYAKESLSTDICDFTGDFTIQTLPGLVDWDGVPMNPVAKKWIASTKTFVDLYTAEQAAAATTSLENPGIGITSLTLPELGGCTVAIKSSSHPNIVKLDGTIEMPDEETQVTLVLTFTDDNGDTADTQPITVTIPKKGEPPVIDVSYLTEYAESGFDMFIFQFNTGNDYGLNNIYNGLQYFDNHDAVWLPPINKPAFRDSIANLLKIQVGDGEAKTITQWGYDWHLAFYVQDGKWIMRFHYRGDDAALKDWPHKTVTVEFLDGFTFPDGTKLNPMKFQRTAADIGAGTMTIIGGSPTAAGIAGGISSDSIPALEKDQTKLPMPTVMDGYSIALTYSSKPEIIALNGTITPPAKATFVTLRFTVTRLSDNTTAETDNISVMVPKGSGVAPDPDDPDPEKPDPTDPDNPDNPTEPTEPGTEDIPQTGDSRVIVLTCVMLAVAAGGSVILTRKRRRA